MNRHITEDDLCDVCRKVKDRCTCPTFFRAKIRLLQKVHGITIVCPWIMHTVKEEEFDTCVEGWEKQNEEHV
jgi:hypothetical protein